MNPIVSLFAQVVMPRRTSTIVLMAVLITACASVGGRAATPDATLLTVEGKVSVSKQAQAAWAPGAVDMALMFGDRVKTGVRSRATVRFSNQSVVRLNELTTMTVRPTNAPPRTPGLEIEDGAVYFFNRERPEAVEIRTPLASGAIRGTEFHLEVEANGATTLTMLDGEVELISELGRVALKTGEQGVVEPNQAPRKTAALNAMNIIQWVLYYPGILDLDELPTNGADVPALAESMRHYRAGDLLKALEAYPENRLPATDAERIYHAALMLAVGQVNQAEQSLQGLGASSPLGGALRQVVAAVKQQVWAREARPTLATEWLAESYYLQSQGRLELARAAARSAVAKSPGCGFAHARLADLEFSFGRTEAAAQAVDAALECSPRNAQAVALKGFLLAARNKLREAESSFDEAIGIDGALGNAWLGRGLCRIKRGQSEAGRRDLQVAATLEPQRALLRSYLGKAWSNAGNNPLAEKELDLAKRLDPNDPTSWLYSALLNQQENRLNEGVRDLEKSADLNDNRRIYRSRLLLDQDRAVRGANLARIYQDAEMKEVAVSEASRALQSDYANHSAHLFLANAYDALRDPRRVTLRYETPWLSEQLMANLLAPVGGGSLSRFVSQQEYSRLFDRDRSGIISRTDYESRGYWWQQSSLYGNYGSTGYSFDFEYLSDNGQRLNADLERCFHSLRLKQQVTPNDVTFFQTDFLNARGGDIYQYYSNVSPRPNQRVRDKFEPGLYLGHNHQWSPGVNTLFLASFIQNRFELDDPGNTMLSFRRDAAGNVIGTPLQLNFPLEYDSALRAYSFEVQQLVQKSRHTTVAGLRYQTSDIDPVAAYTRGFGGFLGVLFPPAGYERVDGDLDRFGAYVYHDWRILDNLTLSGGLTLDYLRYPLNTEVAPLYDGHDSKTRLSPKAGLAWTPWRSTTLRGAYARSLGGSYFDTSVRLEPTQVAGINQAFRSLIPESVVGLVPGTEFETFGVAWDQRFKTGTYLTLGGELLTSDADRAFGTYDRFAGSLTATPVLVNQSNDYEEKSLSLSVNQLAGDNFVLGTVYRLSDARLRQALADLPAAFAGASLNEATLQQLRTYALFHHRCGFFSQIESLWFQQANRGYAADIPGDDFWHLNFYLGYRFANRKAEARLGLLNLTDKNYALNPLNLYYELPRERTVAFTLKFNF